jgi:hypothetical protein
VSRLTGIEAAMQKAGSGRARTHDGDTVGQLQGAEGDQPS